jgi:hypothetical protein
MVKAAGCTHKVKEIDDIHILETRQIKKNVSSEKIMFRDEVQHSCVLNIRNLGQYTVSLIAQED